MCGRYYVNDYTAREIEKLVRQVDEKMRQTAATGIHLQAKDIHATAGVGSVLCGQGYNQKAVFCGDQNHRGVGSGRPGVASEHPEKAGRGDMGLCE